MNNKIKTEGYDENEIIEIITEFYKAYYKSDCLKLYSYLDTDFQRYIPLNYFLIHPNYNKEIGTLLEICKIRIQEERKIALAECLVELQSGKKELVILLKKDFGGWKIDGNRLFK